MDSSSTISLTQNTLIWAFLGSTVVATIIGFVLGWIKEYFHDQQEKENAQFQELYGALTYHLLAMKVLTENKEQLIKEIQTEPGNIQMKNEALGSEPKPLIEKWQMHCSSLEGLLQREPGYIKEEHIGLVEDFLDARIKWELAKGGQSHRATSERMDKLSIAVSNLQKELLP